MIEINNDHHDEDNDSKWININNNKNNTKQHQQTNTNNYNYNYIGNTVDDDDELLSSWLLNNYIWFSPSANDNNN